MPAGPTGNLGSVGSRGPGLSSRLASRRPYLLRNCDVETALLGRRLGYLAPGLSPIRSPSSARRREAASICGLHPLNRSAISWSAILRGCRRMTWLAWSLGDCERACRMAPADMRIAVENAGTVVYHVFLESTAKLPARCLQQRSQGISQGHQTGEGDERSRMYGRAQSLIPNCETGSKFLKRS